MTIVTMTVNPAIDLTATADHVAPDEKLRVRDVRREPGGGGINVARVVIELGGRATAGYLAGGPTGGMLEALLAEADIPQLTIDIEGHTREDVTVSDAASDRQYRFVMPGPEVAEEDCRRLLDALLEQGGDYLVASGSLPPGAPEDWYGTVARRCADAGVRMVLDSSGASLERALEAGVFLVKPNLRELGQLAGRDIEDDRDLEEVAGGLVADGAAEIVVVSLGGGGAAVLSAEGCTRIAAPTVPVRSRVGAGDSAVAGMVTALARGRDAVAAARFGVAAGAAAVMTAGTALCRRQDVETIAERMQEEASGDAAPGPHMK